MDAEVDQRLQSAEPHEAAAVVLAVATLLITVIAVLPRCWQYTSPDHMIFDEVYYAPSAALALGYPPEFCGISGAAEQEWISYRRDPGVWVQPPLGKLFIAAGEWIAGYNTAGWRLGPMVFGSLTPALTFLLAFQLTDRLRPAFIAGMLLAAEHLSIVHSRLATPDIFLTFFGVAGTLSLAAASSATARGASVWAAVGRFSVAGLLFGAAMACKWSALPIMIGGMVAVFYAFWRAPTRSWRNLFIGSLALSVASVGAYAAVYIAWCRITHMPISRLLRLHRQIHAYHRSVPWTENGRPVHAYFSPWWSWLLLRRPIAYFFQDSGRRTIRHVLAVGNPLLFWGSIPALITLFVRCVRSWPRTEHVFVLAPVVFSLLFWALIPRPQFLYHCLPMVPFLSIAAVFACETLADAAEVLGGRGVRQAAEWLGWALFVAYLGSALYFWPLIAGAPLNRADWADRMWLNSWI